MVRKTTESMNEHKIIEPNPLEPLHCRYAKL